MNIMRSPICYVAAACSALLVSACGGGGSGSESGTATGYFIDSPVQGLRYSTATRSGETGADGSFQYVSGETVTFSLYGKTLLSIKASTHLTPLDIDATAVNPNFSINLIRFLMALDTDGVPGNGIRLPAYTGTFDVDFNKSIAEFEADSDGKITAFLSANATGRSLATVQAAATHFTSSLASINSGYVLSLAGRTASSSMTDSYCSNNLTLTRQYNFGVSSVTLQGDEDTFVTVGTSRVCSGNGSATSTITYASIKPGEFLDCAPNCTYRQLNRISFVPSDTDGRTAIEWTWHTPGTNTIVNVKTVLIDPRNPGQAAALSTFREVITLN